MPMEKQGTVENQLAHTIDQTEYDSRYDRTAKKLLANKQILAQIMKGCVNEYSDCTVDIHAEGPAFFCWIPKLFGKRVICTIHGLDWDREKWRGSVASKFIRGGEKNAVKYADEIIVLSKDVQKYFLETYGIL